MRITKKIKFSILFIEYHIHFHNLRISPLILSLSLSFSHTPSRQFNDVQLIKDSPGMSKITSQVIS